MFQKRLPNKIAIGCFARSDKINYWNVKATGGIFYFWSEQANLFTAL